VLICDEAERSPYISDHDFGSSDERLQFGYKGLGFRVQGSGYRF
jgi:hypothetical protein